MFRNTAMKCFLKFFWVLHVELIIHFYTFYILYLKLVAVVWIFFVSCMLLFFCYDVQAVVLHQRPLFFLLFVHSIIPDIVNYFDYFTILIVHYL